MCFDESVVAVTALINYVYLARSVVLENEELVIKQIHLHNCFLSGHRLEGEILAANFEFSLFLEILSRVYYATVKRTAAQSLCKSGLVLAYLSFDDVDRFIKRVSEGFILNLAAEDSAR